MVFCPRYKMLDFAEQPKSFVACCTRNWTLMLSSREVHGGHVVPSASQSLLEPCRYVRLLGNVLPAELEGAPHELLVEALKLLEAQGKAQ